MSSQIISVEIQVKSTWWTKRTVCDFCAFWIHYGYITDSIRTSEGTNNTNEVLEELVCVEISKTFPIVLLWTKTKDAASNFGSSAE